LNYDIQPGRCFRVFSRFFYLERDRPFERTLGARIFSEAERGFKSASHVIAIRQLTDPRNDRVF